MNTRLIQYLIISLLSSFFYCIPSVYAIDTVQNGTWSNPATWQGGVVPPPGSDIRILHQVILNLNVTTNQLEITNGSQLEVGPFSLTVQGGLSLAGQFIDGDDAGTNTFEGNITVSNSGQFIPTANSNYVFRGNIINEGVFNHSGTGTITFAGNIPQSLLATQSITLEGNLLDIQNQLTILDGQTVNLNSQQIQINENTTLRNQNTAGLTLTGFVSGSGTFENAENGYTTYEANDAPEVTLLSAANNSTFVYRSNQNQTIKAGTYYHLEVGNTALADREKSLSGNTTVLGNLTILEGLQGNTLFTTQTHDLTLEGNFQSEGQFLTDDSRMIFQGNQPQNLAQNAGTIRFFEIVLNKTGGAVSNTSPIEVSNRIIFTQGFWESSQTNPLIFLENSSAEGASSQSFVRGAVQKIGNQAFNFPIGAENIFAPMSISNLSQNDTFTASYTHTAHPQAGVNNPDFTFISQVEYWTLTKQNPNTMYQIGLSWADGTLSGIQQPSDLALIHWNGTLWQAYAAAAQGNANAGQLQSTQSINLQGDFTFASLEALNSLGNTDLVPPSPLLESVLVTEAGHIALTWQDLAFQETSYRIARSTEDNPTFVTYQELPRNSTTFIDTQVTQGQTYFYNLTALNNFGASAPSNVLGALVGIISNLENPLEALPQAYPNPSSGSFVIHNPFFPIHLFDAQGKEVQFDKEIHQQRVIQIDISFLPSGLYFLRLGAEIPVILKILKE